MKKATFIGFAFIFLCAVLAGCQGYREIDGEYFISAIGFESEEEGYTVYAEVLEVIADKNDTESKVFSATAKTPYEAVENITAQLPKKAVLDHCGTAIISNKITNGSFKRIIEYLYDAKNLNLGICLYCAEDVKEVLSQKPQSTSIGYDIMAIKNNIEKVSGIEFKNKYYEACALQISKKGFCLPEISVGESLKISGRTVYMNFSPVLYLEKGEAMIFSLLLSGGKGGEISVEGKRCRFNKIRTKISEERDTVNINMNIEYRSKKHRATAALERQTESLAKRLFLSPAGRLVFSDYANTKEVRVTVYER